jgi:sec-independent protein translocase protein TatC
MFLPKLLKMRDKLTQKRKRLQFEDEMPFLEHLEDLRKMLMKIIITLLIAMFASMVWYKDFLDIVKWPAKRAGLNIAEDKNRPEGVKNADDWEKVKELAQAMTEMTESQRRAFLETAGQENETRKVYAEALLVHRLAWHFGALRNKEGKSRDLSDVEKKNREAFLAKLGDLPPGVKDAVSALEKAGTRPELEPSKPAIELVWRKPMEAFFTAVKLSLYAGLIVSFPLVFYFLMQFILPGLTIREKKLLGPALLIGFGLFLAGLLFAFFYVVPWTLQFGHEFGSDIEGTRDMWTFAEYVSFVTVFSLVFGLSYELPVVVLALVRLGLLSSAFMRRTRSWAIVIIVTVAAIITPTGDPGTLAAMAGPMIVMYEACIWIAVWMEKRQARREEQERLEEERRKARIAEERRTLPPPADEPPADGGHDEPPPSGPAAAGAAAPLDLAGEQENDGHSQEHDHHLDAYHRDHDHAHDDLIHHPDHDHDAWLREQEEIYRSEHPHLFGTEETPPHAAEGEQPVPDETPGLASGAKDGHPPSGEEGEDEKKA